MVTYREIKSRNSTTKDFGAKVQVRTKIPANTCHRGENIEFHSLETPPTWHCAKCGKVILVETPVNDAIIMEKSPMNIWAFHLTDTQGKSPDLSWVVARGETESAAKKAASGIVQGLVLGAGKQMVGENVKRWDELLSADKVEAQLFAEVG